jgi:hypothetical protein
MGTVSLDLRVLTQSLDLHVQATHGAVLVAVPPYRDCHDALVSTAGFESCLQA